MKIRKNNKETERWLSLLHYKPGDEKEYIQKKYYGKLHYSIPYFGKLNFSGFTHYHKKKLGSFPKMIIVAGDRRIVFNTKLGELRRTMKELEVLEIELTSIKDSKIIKPIQFTLSFDKDENVYSIKNDYLEVIYARRKLSLLFKDLWEEIDYIKKELIYVKDTKTLSAGAFNLRKKWKEFLI